MSTQVLAVYREPEFSPGRVEADADILEAVVGELAACGLTCSAVDAQSFAAGVEIAGPMVLAMCQGEPALKRLAEAEKAGTIAINSASAIRNCYRDRLGAFLQRADVPTPEGAVLDTRAPIDLAALDGLCFEAGVYVKRGDLHALGPDDVRYVRGRQSLLGALEAFARRGIPRAYVQRAIEGETVKFYGVSGGEYFAALCGDGEVSQRAARALAEAATRAAEALGLEVWGGDAVLNGERLAMVDFNDWPSYGRVRRAAARAIARRAVKLLEAAR